jgi:hypothetical protein
MVGEESQRRMTQEQVIGVCPWDLPWSGGVRNLYFYPVKAYVRRLKLFREFGFKK